MFTTHRKREALANRPERVTRSIGELTVCNGRSGMSSRLAGLRRSTETDLYCQMFVGARNYWVRSIVRRLERFANNILPNEDMSCGCQVRIYVTVAMSWARGQWADLLHV